MNQSEALAAAVTQHQDLIAASKRRYTQCVSQLVAAPADQALLSELTTLSSTLASAAAGLDALAQALDLAREADEQLAVEQRKTAGRKRAVLVRERVKARRASYSALQNAADNFLAVLRDHVAGGVALRADANAAAADVFGDRAGDHLVSAADAAAGTTSIDALAVASVLRDAIEVFGVKRLDRYIGADSFARGVTFIEAHAADAAIVERLAA